MKRILAFLLALGLAVAGAGAAWAGGLSQYVTVRGYDPEVDYMRAMKQALEDGSPYAMEVGALYEQQRNLKIQELELPQEQTAYFSQYGEAEEILEAMAQAEAPEAAYTQADLDLLSRLIYAEAGCTWIPDWVQRMVGSVVLNRVESQYYPDTIREVIYQPGQYAPTWDGSLQKTPDARTIENARYLLEHGSICPENVVGQNSIITGSGVYPSYYDQVLDTTIYFCYL